MKQKNSLVKSVAIILLLAGSLTAPALQKYLVKNSNTAKIRIGILQTASHPGLDNAREGCMQEIKPLVNEIDFMIKNGKGQS